MKTASELFAEAKARIREVTPKETMAQLAERPDTLVIDCREPNEFQLAKISGAVCIPRGILESNIESQADRQRPIVLYCASGNRSALAVLSLQEMGFVDVASMSGGFRGWVDAGGEIEG